MKPSNANAYLKTKVMTASPAELRLMLFDGAIRFAQQGRDGLAAKDYEASYLGISKCQNILMELINGLRPEHDPALCEKLSALYTFMYTQLITASREKSPETVDGVIKLLRYERETWQMLLDQLVSENSSARTVDQMPAAKPSFAAASHSASQLVSGSVSLKG